MTSLPGCADCITEERASDGAPVILEFCGPCANLNQSLLLKYHRKQKAAPKCEECGEATEGHAHDLCTSCCEHGDICRDDRICLSCGEDMTEHFIAMAEGAAEGDR